jgi:hypothetical protein
MTTHGRRDGKDPLPNFPSERREDLDRKPLEIGGAFNGI